MENKNQPAQDIDIDNNPVNKDNDIIPEDKNIEETISTSTTIDTTTRMSDKDIEEMNNNTIAMIEDPIPPSPGNDTDNINRIKTKNPVRYIDSGFTF